MAFNLVKLTITSILLKVVASALKEFPIFDGSVDEEKEETFTTKVDPFPNFDGNTFQAIRGGGSQLVHESIPVHTSETSNIRITTIHSVKGQTFEAVMVVSAPSTQGT